MTQEEIDYIHDLALNNKLSTEEMLAMLKSSGLTEEIITDTLFKLLVKQPDEHNYVRINSNTPYAKRVLDKGKRSCTMYNLLLHKGKIDGFADFVLLLYNKDYMDTRRILDYIDDLDGDDKIPYLKLLITNYCLFFGIEGDIFHKTRTFMYDYDLLTINLSKLKNEYGYLKLIGGETYSDLGRYDSIIKLINIDTKAIDEADIGVDLGGGYMTPELSRLFNKDLVCLDKTDPKTVLEIREYTNFNDGYIDKLLKQEWLNKDLIFDSLPDSYNTYFITSFGFINSTIGPRDYLRNRYERVSNYVITYMACKRLAELIYKKKDVYCIFWGRPTSRVHENKLLNIRFMYGRLVMDEILNDPYSDKYSNNGLFGAEKVIKFI